ncbi:MAG: nucleoside triphosphate pyrophosphohydrolase [Candidatus Portnoybacteria bacterium]|nr:nucleoside triphosphate pyrophosphohydrolase [Candidatus Portnoybacteria bacterium]
MPIYNKLVRDLIPEIIKKDGEVPKTRILNKREYKLELLKKLVEESKEALKTKDSKKDLTKEVGDVMEVLEAIKKAYNLDKKEILKLKKERKKKRGGFTKRIFLERAD